MLHISHDQRVLGRTAKIAPTGLRLKVLPVAVALCFCPALWAGFNDTTAGLPMGGTVAAGSVSGGVTGNQLTLTQTGSRAVIDWQSFNINAGKTVQFVQPSATAAVLNRVPASAGLSEIYGTLTANGMVLLMNPNGVLFGAGSNINVGSLIATTGTINQSDFMAGGAFAISGANAGSVTNRGTITAQSAGLVALVAPSVSNQGIISATGGRIALSGADRATVSFNGGLYEFAVDAGALGTNASISNAAGARLEGATIFMSTGDAANLLSGTINLEGVQRASSAIVVNGNTVVLKSDLDAPAISGNSSSIQVQAGASIQDAVKIAKTGTPGAGATVDVQAGTYAELVTPTKEQVTLNKANLTLSGHEGAKLVVPNDPEVNGILISANNVTVQGLEIAGPLNGTPYYNYYHIVYSSGSPPVVTPTNISRGIKVGTGITGFMIRDNNIHDVRNGVLIDGINNTGTVSNNNIENTKSGISVQYTDGTGVTIAGNSEGPIGNEWGLNLHLNIAPAAKLAAPTLAWQQSLLNLSAANSGWAVQDQGYLASNRTQVNVVSTPTDPSNQGSRLTPIDTIQGGINAAVTGGKVNVAAGTYLQSSTLIVNKSVTLAGAGEAATMIDARGITGNYGMNVSADNVTLRDFTFYGPSTFFNSAYGIKVSPGGSADARLHNFTIMNVTSRGAGKAELDLNGVDGALIDHVTLNGAPVGNDAGTTQGAGLQLTDSANVTVRNTTTLNNAWGGVALYQANRSYNQRVNNISIEGNNHFLEVNPVYMQDESALQDFGTLNIAGFGYAVRNAASTDSGQYTWLQATQQNAYNFAVNLPGASSSYIQGWNGAAKTQNYEVGIGNLAGGGTQAMSIANALNQSASGANINVGAGSYNESVSLSSPRNLNFADATLQGLVLNAGAADSGIGGRVTVNGVTGVIFNAPVNLLGDTLLATNGANITLNGHVQNANGVQYSLTLTAGSGSNRGDVSMTTGGSESNPLNQFEVTANRFSLSDTLWVQRYKINALGDVALSNHTLRAMDAGVTSTLTTTGNVTGATTSKGSVEVVSSGDVSANVTTDGKTSVAANNISGNISSKSSVDLVGSGDVSANVVADGKTTVAANNITGSISGSDVALTAQGKVDVVVTATNSASLSGGTIAGTVSAPTAVVDSGSSVQLALNTNTATVHAEGGVSLSGTSSSINIDAPSGSVSGNFGAVSNAGNGLFSVNGKPELNQTLTANTENNRVIPGGSGISENTAPDIFPSIGLTRAVALSGSRGEQISRTTAAGAGNSIDRGQPVEIDLTPGNEKKKR